MPDAVPNTMLSHFVASSITAMLCCSGLSGGDFSKLPVLMLLPVLRSGLPLQKRGSALPDCPFSQERQEIHIFIDIS